MGLEEDIKKFVKLKKGKAIVNWQAIKNLPQKAGTYNRDLYNATMQRLVDLKVLSLSADGNYGLYSDSLSLNPRLRMSELFFTDVEDVKKYKQVKYGTVLYKISIRKLEEIT